MGDPLEDSETQTKLDLTQPTPPPTVDYREDPNAGQAGTEEHNPSVYGDPNTEGTPMPPQPKIGERGYSLNNYNAIPNRMIPGKPDEHLPDVPSDEARDPTSIAYYDLTDTT